MAGRARGIGTHGQRPAVVWVMAMPRSAIIWTRSRELSLNVRYHRTHRTMISWSKCRPLNRFCTEVGSVIPAVIAGYRAFQQFAPEPVCHPCRSADCQNAIKEALGRSVYGDLEALTRGPRCSKSPFGTAWALIAKISRYPPMFLIALATRVQCLSPSSY
jgi:hypothetical protein